MRWLIGDKMAVYPINEIELEANELQSNINFDRVEIQTKKKPELQDSGGTKHDSVKESGNMDTGIPILSHSPNSYKEYGAIVTNPRFIKFIPSDSSDWLQKNHPNAFLLLCLIAKRARRFNGHVDGLEIGMAQIGDYQSAGIETEQKYRTAKNVLIRIGAIKIIETARKRKNSTTGLTTKGTLVTILKSDIWDINPEVDNDRANDRATTKQRPSNDEQERRKKEEREVISNITLSDSQAHQTKVSEKIFFDWEKMKLKGIESSDLDTWKETFTHVDVPEYIKFIEQDIGAKPTKYKKRKQIIKTILYYFQNKNENIAAYQKHQTNHKNSQGKNENTSSTTREFSGKRSKKY